jgi:tRNA pseudouridine55 synthase
MKSKGPSGLLVLDKPGGVTSRLVVDRAERWFPRGTRVGHTGTLDPLATGVLLLCLGSATRLTEYVQGMAKTYRTRILLGARSDTDDADGTITAVENVCPPDRGRVRETIRQFLGVIEQVPPAHSAAKVAGTRAYDLARRGKEVRLRPRQVRIDRIDLLAYRYPYLDLEVRCGKGTYIRSLARDLGEQLGCGGLVETLRRTRVGPFTAEQGVSLDAGAETALGQLLPIERAVAELPSVHVDEGTARQLGHGRKVILKDSPAGLSQEDSSGKVAVFSSAGRFVGIARWDRARNLLEPEKILA